MRKLIEKIALNISGRNAFKFILIIIITHLIVMLIYMNNNRLERGAERREAVIQKIVNVINLIYATPVLNRGHAIKAMTDPYLDASITSEPTHSLQFRTVSYWQISQSLHHQLGLFSISIQLEPKQWLNLRATIYSHFLINQLLFFGVELIIFVFVLLVLWAVGRFTQPFLNFTAMAERLGDDPNSKLLPLSGPFVVREASKAMNRMQQRIQELIRDRTQMLAAISHDLRTPITRMRLRAQFITDPEITSSLIEDLGEMETMINETLAFARDDGSSEEKTQIDLVSMVSSLCADMQDLGHKVKFKCRCHRIAFHGRPVALKRAFNNLLGNATRYAKQVEVKLYRRRSLIIILVNDDGPGIAEKELERVFAPFYRGEHSRNRDTGGVGLGLAVTREIIKLHGGQVSLHNRKRGGLSAVIAFPSPLAREV